MLKWLFQQFRTTSAAPTMLDHLPVSGSFVDGDGSRCSMSPADPIGKGLTHREKLELAATRAGQPFKCAADGLPRIVTKDGIDVAVGVPMTLAPEPPPLPNVTTIKRKKS